MTTAIATIPNLPQIEGANLLNLMIVDDERAIREVCRDVAQTLGFHTSIADSAEHAYRVLESNAIDVVLLDLKLWPRRCARNWKYRRRRPATTTGCGSRFLQ